MLTEYIIIISLKEAILPKGFSAVQAFPAAGQTAFISPV